MHPETDALEPDIQTGAIPFVRMVIETALHAQVMIQATVLCAPGVNCDVFDKLAGLDAFFGEEMRAINLQPDVLPKRDIGFVVRESELEARVFGVVHD